MNTLRQLLVFILPVILFFSCSRKEDIEIKNYSYQVSQNDSLKIMLGIFGDEEGAVIWEGPKHAAQSMLIRDVGSSEIFYLYSPEPLYKGTDSVRIIESRGSDGASAGMKDTLLITFIVN